MTVINHPRDLAKLRYMQRRGMALHPRQVNMPRERGYRAGVSNAPGLGELPYREIPGPMHDPGAGLYPQWENRYTLANFPFTIGLASVQLLPANPLRTYLLVQNKDAANDLLINFGQSVTAYNGVIIIPRGNYEFVGGAGGGPFSPSDSIHVLGTAAAQDGVAVEGILPPMSPGDF